jgi:hypothetical protein
MLEDIDTDADLHTATPDHDTPLQAIRKHCLECCNGSSNEVSLCVSKRCPLWTLRFGRKPTDEEVQEVAGCATHPQEDFKTQAEVATGSRLKAIRRRCLDCSGYSQAEVSGCKFKACDLYPFRMGKGHARTFTAQQKAALAARFSGKGTG